MTLHEHDTNLARKTYERKTADGYLVVEACLTHLSGNDRPYFSVTGELWQSAGWYRNGQDGRMHECGQLHDRILRAFPKLAPIVALHLADDTGAPMYAVENGWYWYEQSHDQGADYLRVTPEELPAGMDKEEFVAYVETLRWQWRYEANKAIEFLNKDSAEAL